MDFIDPDRFRYFTAANTVFVINMTAPADEDIKLLSEIALFEAREKLQNLEKSLADDPESESRMRYYYEGEKKHLLDFKKYMSEDEARALAERLECPKVSPDKEITLTPWQKYARNIVAKRLTRGLPHDLAAVPFKKRKTLPGLALYAPFANAMANLDGETDLYTIIKRAFWESGYNASDRDYKSYVSFVNYLAEWGYLEVKGETLLTKDDIVSALQRSGLSEGDTVLVHSSLTAFGSIEGGAKTVVEAFLEVIGNDGTLMAPAFTAPYMYFEGEHWKLRRFRPFNRKNLGLITTGTLPKVMLGDFGAVRSAHATHSWAAIGKNAEAYTSVHGMLDAPCGPGNPMEKALENGAKLMFFGCGVSSNTFLHYLETEADSSFVANAIVKIEREDGKLTTELIRKQMPGCRDFYYFTKPEGCKFYDRAVERGMKITKETLGVGDIYTMDLRELYTVGTELFKEDPDVTLCDRPQCLFCKKYRHKQI